ncbi:protein lin-28 homolog A-like [Sinocyclocheilus anshuiensis]|uniref:protein lin-28 homolog A-like n=1 Tax=Sinocyclocheilus anshuiensis TaxID=1608454 RepID=UPI0007BAC42A|nr:PREDICTED: protein lin-28 homolog A-like [Sinocyclocheilus anshuiensis]
MAEGGCAKTEEEEAASSEEDSSSVRGSGFCKWFNVRMGFGFLSMTHREGICLDSPVDVFVHQSKLHMEGFRSLKEGEAVAFTFKRSSKDASTVEGRIITPKNANCHLSRKSAIFAKASPTWWPTVQSKHSSCPRDLRENQQPPLQEKKRT